MKPPRQRVFSALVLICAALFLALGARSALAADSDFVWAKAMGGIYSDYGRSVAVDIAGNVYTIGNFEDTVDFDPGVGTYNLTPVGNGGIFISKLDVNGSFVWAKAFSVAGFDTAHSIAVDAIGNVFTTGGFGGTVDFDPGVGNFNLTSAGGRSIFVLKLDTNGNFVWVKAIDGAAGIGTGNSISVDVFGNLYTAGEFNGTVDFDPSAGIFNLTSVGGFSNDIFLSKLDRNGNFVWAKRFGWLDHDSASSVAVDTLGNVYATGIFRGTVSMGTFILASVGFQDAFVIKLDANGNVAWAKALNNGGAPTDQVIASSLRVDLAGNVYTTGDFVGTTDFDPGSGVSMLTSSGYEDIFISKFDVNGDFVWVKSMGGGVGVFAKGYSIALDTLGNIYTTGAFSDSVDFDPGEGTFILASSGYYDIFISKLDANGMFGWAKVVGGNNDDKGNSIAVDAGGNVYCTGIFWEPADFDPDAAIFNLTSVANSDVFVLKLSGPPETTPPTFTPITASLYFAEAGQTVTITFTASEALQANPTVTINTNTATFSSVNGLSYEYTYTVTGTDTLGAATIEITGQDIIGNIGTGSNNTSLVIVAAGAVPLAAWPGIIALAAAGAIALRRRKLGAHVSPHA